MQAEFHPCYNHVRKPCSPRTWTWHQGAQGGNRTIITDTACVTNSIWEQTLQENIVNTMQLVAGDRQWPYHVHGIYTMCIYVHTLDSPITCMEVWDHHKFTAGSGHPWDRAAFIFSKADDWVIASTLRQAWWQVRAWLQCTMFHDYRQYNTKYAEFARDLRVHLPFGRDLKVHLLFAGDSKVHLPIF